MSSSEPGAGVVLDPGCAEESTSPEPSDDSDVSPPSPTVPSVDEPPSSDDDVLLDSPSVDDSDDVSGELSSPEPSVDPLGEVTPSPLPTVDSSDSELGK